MQLTNTHLLVRHIARLGLRGARIAYLLLVVQATNGLVGMTGASMPTVDGLYRSGHAGVSLPRPLLPSLSVPPRCGRLVFPLTDSRPLHAAWALNNLVRSFSALCARGSLVPSQSVRQAVSPAQARSTNTWKSLLRVSGSKWAAGRLALLPSLPHRQRKRHNQWSGLLGPDR